MIGHLSDHSKLLPSSSSALARLEACWLAPTETLSQLLNPWSFVVLLAAIPEPASAPTRFVQSKDPRTSTACGTEEKTTEAVRKRGEFLRRAEQSEILRDFLGSERPEARKSEQNRSA